MTLSPPLNDECYKSSLIEDLVCPDIDDGSLQEELKHSPNSSLVPKYARVDYILASRPNNKACCKQLEYKNGNNLVLRSIFKSGSEVEVM